MVFASFVFLFWFLPLFVPLYFATPRPARNLVLTVASCVFYGWERPQYVLLMIGTIAVDYAIARAMGEPGSGRSVRTRKALLVVSIVSNLGVLAWFKYANLFVTTWNDLAPAASAIAWQDIVLPIGISFFTFQSMSYTIDVYRGDVKPERSFLDLLCFVSMFPQLVAGPIVRYHDVQAELHDRRVDLRRGTDGLFRFLLGLAKKVLIADSLAPFVDHVYAQQAPGAIAAWSGAFAYTIQIYFDFSGYSDMAIGLGAMLGFRFPENFRSPLRSHSMTEFWRRWHISLSTWLRDYLYFPLGGNRTGEGRAQWNLFVTMLLAGLWHGAGWTYLVFGCFHGALLVLERRIGRNAPWHLGVLPHRAQVAFTFVVWTIGLVIFRSPTLAKTGAMFAGMAGANGAGAFPDAGQHQPLALGALVLGTGIAFLVPRAELLVARFHPLVMLGTLLLFVLSVVQMLTYDYVAFIYYQF
jgi:alginate O-acetyltransferase complex protein AlgI